MTIIEDSFVELDVVRIAFSYVLIRVVSRGSALAPFPAQAAIKMTLPTIPTAKIFKKDGFMLSPA
ncbi:MAG: hypothetical protein GY822_14195 [Deltaproteobacteria bacterium]|nr:hypothetical protein [Deltaproteobacteria bacterium]